MLSRHIERRAARRPYWQINDQSTDLIGRLYQEDDAAARAVLLRGLADADVELAVLHPVAFGADPNPDEGGRDLAESLAAAGDLCWLVARTEEMVAAAEWTPARDLHTDHNLWRPDLFGWAPVTGVSPGSDKGVVHVGLGEYTTLVLHEHDLVRTGGPALSVLELAPFSEAGARGVELELWAELATTADRAHRARLLDAIWEHAAKRVGGQAAEALIAIADTEAHLAASTATGQPAEVAWQPSRRAIAARFFGIGVLLMLPTLPMSLWASWVLDAAAAFLLIDGIAYALGYRRDWRTALRCKHTGHRLMSARHRRSPGRCGPSSWQIASQMTRRTS